MNGRRMTFKHKNVYHDTVEEISSIEPSCIRNNDIFKFTIRNKGSGLLTINSDSGIFITLNSLEASTCCLIYNESTQTFFPYELYRGAIVL